MMMVVFQSEVIMQIRTATKKDLDTILSIYAHARKYMRENGNPTQWGNGYPEEEILCEDIELNRLFVCTDEEEILGVFCYFFGDDPTYERIYDGSWKNDLPYGVLHRIAVVSHRAGVASFCYDYCFSQCKNLKIDTHRNNIPMQKSLAKNGFSYCVIIYLESGDERLDYQKFE